jgi:zinc transport system substrate-binding protein
MEDDHGHDHSHEIDPDDIRDRPLSDWAGSWRTIEDALSSGALDEYVSHQAEENGADFAAQKADYTQRWRSGYPSLEITGDGLIIGGKTAAYRYIGYRLVESDHGSSVWYGFEAVDAASGVPGYIAFQRSRHRRPRGRGGARG